MGHSGRLGFVICPESSMEGGTRASGFTLPAWGSSLMGSQFQRILHTRPVVLNLFESCIWRKLFPRNCESCIQFQGPVEPVGCGPAAEASLGGLWEMHIHGPHSDQLPQNPWGRNPGIWVWTRWPRCLACTLKPTKFWFRAGALEREAHVGVLAALSISATLRMFIIIVF